MLCVNMPAAFAKLRSFSYHCIATKHNNYENKKRLSTFIYLIITTLMLHNSIAQDASVKDSYKASRVDVPLKGKILIITGNDYNDTELLYPYYRFVEAGYEVTIATPEGGDVTGYHSVTIKNTTPVAEIKVAEYAGLYLPGGRAPAKLRDNEMVLEKVDHFVRTGKPVAAICHGPQILARLRMLGGKNVTAWPNIEGEMKDAGATFINQAVVKDGNLVTARMPGDLPPHLHAFLKMLEKE
jgi:protease I